MLNPGDPWWSPQEISGWLVWRCVEDSSLCDEAGAGTLMAFPAPENGADTRVCPSCGKLSLTATGHTVADLQAIEEALGTDMDLVIPRPPPFELVPLLNIPQRMWLGLTAFVASSQMGEEVNWWSYDTGSIMDVWVEGSVARVRFFSSVGGHQSTLNYAAAFCWVPKPLADRLLMSDIERLADECRMGDDNDA